MGALAFAASIVRSLAWPAAVVVLGVIFRERIREVIRGIAERIPYLRSVKAGGTQWTFDSDEMASTKIAAEAMVGRAAHDGASSLADVLVTPSGPKRPWGNLRASSPAPPGLPNEPEPPPTPQAPPTQDGSAGEPAIDSIAAGLLDSAAAVLTSQYRLRAVGVRSLAQLAPAEGILSAWSGIEDVLRGIAGPLGIPDPGSPGLLAEEVITELGQRGALPAPDRTRSVVQRLLSLKVPVEHGAAVTKLDAIDYAETALQITDLLVSAYVTAIASRTNGRQPPEPARP